MDFELWLCVVKRLGQTVDATKMIYDGLTEVEKKSLHDEYEKFIATK